MQPSQQPSQHLSPVYIPSQPPQQPSVSISPSNVPQNVQNTYMQGNPGNLEGRNVGDLTNLSLKPQIPPKPPHLQGKPIQLRDTSPNNEDHVNQQDLENAKKNVNDANVAIEETPDPSKEDSSVFKNFKDTVKGLWKVDLVRAVVFTAVAVLAAAAVVGLAVAIPFSGGAVALPLMALGLGVATMVFEGALVGAFLTIGGNTPPGTPAPAAQPKNFNDSYNDLAEKVKNKNNTPGYKRPSFEEFYANENVKTVLDKDPEGKLSPLVKEWFDHMKSGNKGISKLREEMNTKIEEQTRLKQELKASVDKKNQACEKIYEEMDKLSPELGDLYRSLNIQLSKDEKAMNRELIGRIAQKIKNIDDTFDDAKKAAHKGLSLEQQSEIDNWKLQYQQVYNLDSDIRGLKERIGNIKQVQDEQFEDILKNCDTLEKLQTMDQKTFSALPPS